jgi:multicomponent Na+:H+ antiporter subunit A
VIAAATPVVLGEPMAVKLTLWHGVNTAFVLSLVTLALGVAAWFCRGYLRQTNEATGCLATLGPASLYDAGIAGMLGFATLQTQLLQHGFLRNYLFAVLLVLAALLCAALFAAGGMGALADGQPILLHETLVALLIIGATLATARVRTRLGTVACLGAVGFGVAALYVFYSAPDLAMTQIVVESLVVVLFALVVFAMPRVSERSEGAVRRRDVAISIFVGGLMGALAYGASLTPKSSALSDFYLAASVPEGHGRNIVNVILVDFRALDTLGEITVLAIAAVSALALWRAWHHPATVHCTEDRHP